MHSDDASNYDENGTHLAAATLEREGKNRGVYYTAADLMGTDFPEPRWAVPGLVAEGLTILAGAPKLGKSWLCLDLAVAIASGTPALGKIDTLQGDVLYAALEDPPRRLKSRLQKLLEDGPAPSRLAIVTELPAGQVGIDLVAGWLEDHPDARLVVVDVLQKVRPPAQAGTSAYEADYRVVSAFKALADRYQVAVVVVHHQRKMAADDVFDTVSGSTGLTGGADATVVLRRARGENSASINVTGRDVVESEYALTFHGDNCRWTLDGDALADSAQIAATNRVSDGLGDKAAEIVALLAQHPDGIGPTAVGAAVGMTAQNAGTYLQRLETAGRLAKVGRGRYALVETVESVETEMDNVVPFHGFHTFHTPPEGDE